MKVEKQAVREGMDHSVDGSPLNFSAAVSVMGKREGAQSICSNTGSFFRLKN